MLVRYRVGREHVDEHLELLAAAFAEMEMLRPPSLRYHAHQLDDGVTFVDLVEGDDLPAPLPDLEAFQRYRAGLEGRCDEPPTMIELVALHSYPPGRESREADEARQAVMPTPLAFTTAEIDYLQGQQLGRLATVDRAGRPQNNPVGFVLDQAEHQVVIGGLAMGASRKFRNAATNPNVAFVVDDLASVEPWAPRGVEVRGIAQTLHNVEPPMRGFSREIVRVTPTWIGTWGLEPGTSFDMTVRRTA